MCSSSTDRASSTKPPRQPIATPLLLLAIASAALAGAAISIEPLLGLGIAAGVAYSLVVLERPVVGVYTCFAVVPITAGFRRGMIVPGAKLDEALIVVTFVLVAGFAGRTRDWGPVDRALAAFAAAAFAIPVTSAVIVGSLLEPIGVQKMAVFVVYLLLFRLVRIGHLNAEQRWTAVTLLFASTIPVIVVALMQRFDLLGVRQLIASLTDAPTLKRWSYVFGDARNRATGLFEDWHSMAGYMFPIFLLGVALVVDTATDARRRRIAAIGAGVAFAGIVAAQTITTLLIAIAMAVLIGALYQRLARTTATIVIIGTLAAALSGGALTERISAQFEESTLGANLEARIDIWTQDYAGPLGRYWATGYGPEIPPEITWDHTESLYVTLVLRGGVLLLAAYLLVTCVVIAVAWRGRRAVDPFDRALSIAVFAAVVGSLGMHLVFPYLTSSGFPHTFWLLAGLLPVGDGVTARTVPGSRDDVSTESGQLIGSRP